MQPLRRTQFCIIFFALAILLVGVIIVVPSWKSYWHVPSTSTFELSLNLCPASPDKDPITNTYHFVGYMGPCPPLPPSCPPLPSSPLSPSPSPSSIPSLPTPSPTPTPFFLSSQDQVFDPGMDYFDGGVFPIESSLLVTKRVTGSLKWEIVREGETSPLFSQSVDVFDSDLVGNFGVVGGGNISIIRNSPYNLGGWTNDTSECLSPPGCIYYPLLSTFSQPSNTTFKLPESNKKTLIRVTDVDLYFESNLTSIIPIDVILRFENQHIEDEYIVIFFLILGFLLIDATPGITYFLWFQEEAYYGHSDFPDPDEKDSERDSSGHLNE